MGASSVLQPSGWSLQTVVVVVVVVVEIGPGGLEMSKQRLEMSGLRLEALMMHFGVLELDLEVSKPRRGVLESDFGLQTTTVRS